MTSKRMIAVMEKGVVINMTIWKRIKKAFDRYLENLAEENKKTFGTGRMDCCNLNRDTKKQN
jgi:hypothetical protein